MRMMTKRLRSLAVLALLGGLCTGGRVELPAAAQTTAADAQTEARALIAWAVKAHGGTEQLSKFKSYSAKWEGKRKVENFYWDSSNVATYHLPDKVRIDSEVLNPNGGRFSVYKIANGSKGWQGSGTRVRELKSAEVTQLLDEMYAPWVASLVPLDDKGFAFAPLGQAIVADKEAIGVRVSHKDRPDVNLYFDKQTGLVVKSERRAKEAGTAEEYTLESIYSGHKAFQGVMWPTQRHDKRDGMDLANGAGRFTMSDYQALDGPNEALFSKP